MSVVCKRIDFRRIYGYQVHSLFFSFKNGLAPASEPSSQNRPNMGPGLLNARTTPAQPPHNPPFEPFPITDLFFDFGGELVLPILEPPLAGVVYKGIDFTWERYIKGWILDGSGIPKDRFYMRVVYKRMDFRREWYTKGYILHEIGIQRMDFRREWYTKE